MAISLLHNLLKLVTADNKNLSLVCFLHHSLLMLQRR
jgi:hypothetical protein